MAKYCTNCGTELKENAKFCHQCGTPVLQDNNGIKVYEDGKGGLIIDAPEGSTVTISDEMPKKEG